MDETRGKERDLETGKHINIKIESPHNRTSKPFTFEVATNVAISFHFHCPFYHRYLVIYEIQH